MPEHIVDWNFASDDWQCPKASNDLRPGGAFSSRMEAKDGSAGFDFGGVYDEVVPFQKIAYTIADGRKVEVTFQEEGGKTRVTETFDMENENPEEMQREGWQAVLLNFKRSVESK